MRPKRCMTKQRQQPGLLRPQEPDTLGIPPDISKPSNNQSMLRTPTLPEILAMDGNHSELGEQLLNLPSQPIAVGAVLNRERVVGLAVAAVTLEGCHEEGALDT